MNRAEDLFHRIMIDPKNEIEAIVNRRESEDTWLDFKAPDKEQGGWAKVQDLFSKAVAGFGNTDGGIILWGITTKKKKNIYGDVVDAADGFSLISDPIVISSGLDNEVSRSTFPAHPGVVNEPLGLWENGSGVVVTYVPLCSHRPLQRAYQGTKDFLMRAGDSFVAMPYPLLASMFGRPPHPSVEIKVRAVAGYASDSNQADEYLRKEPRDKSSSLKFIFVLELQNCGTIPARGCYVSAVVEAYSEKKVAMWPSDEKIYDSSTWQHRIFRHTNNKTGYYASLNNSVFVPGELDRVWMLSVSLPLGADGRVSLEVKAGADSSAPHCVNFRASAQQISEIDLQLQSDQLNDIELQLSKYA